jgi:hypothetical protein
LEDLGDAGDRQQLAVGRSLGGWWRGIFQEVRRLEMIWAVNRWPVAKRRPWRLRIPAIVASTSSARAPRDAHASGAPARSPR